MCLVIQLCLTLCGPMNHRTPGSSVHGIFQARILEGVAISSSRGDIIQKTFWSFFHCAPASLPYPAEVQSRECKIQNWEDHIQVLALLLTSWATRPKSLFWKEQVKCCLHTILMNTECYMFIVLLLPTWVRHCTSDGSHGIKIASAASGAMVKKESINYKWNICFYCWGNWGMEC